jgi:predicted Rossmann-fold nucleotide-binding protein
MAAATLGAKAGKGKVEIVAMDPKREPGNYEGIAKNNMNLADKKVLMKSYPGRLNRLIKDADAFVIFKGGAGTLSEIGLTWDLAKFNYGNHEPLIFYGSFWRKIIYGLFKGLNLEKMEKQVVQVADRPEKVLRLLGGSRLD